MSLFSLNNKRTDVLALERALRKAIVAFSEAEQQSKKLSLEKSIGKLATKLFTARLKLLKAMHHEAATPAGNGTASARASSIVERKLKLEAGGASEILGEFGFRQSTAPWWSEMLDGFLPWPSV